MTVVCTNTRWHFSALSHCNCHIRVTQSQSIKPLPISIGTLAGTIVLATLGMNEYEYEIPFDDEELETIAAARCWMDCALCQCWAPLLLCSPKYEKLAAWMRGVITK